MRLRPRPLAGFLMAGAFVCAGAGFGPSVAGAAQGATVTASVGSTKAGSEQVEQLGGVAEGEPVETAEDGGCSLLLQEDALVEVCSDTKLSLRKREPGGPRVLDVQKGNVKVSADKQLGGERIEIHTPAVIATILGTVVFVSVDALGVTTITSEVSRVMVASSNTALSQATVIEGGQQLVVKPGEPPPTKPERLDAKQMAALGGCLVDFHSASLQSDRKEMLGSELDAISQQDALTADLPEVALVEPGGAEGWPGPGSTAPGVPDMPGPEFPDPTTPPGYNVDPPYPPTSVNLEVQELVEQIIDGETGPPDDFPGGECPGGIPGEQCGPF
jgi:FecR protein